MLFFSLHPRLLWVIHKQGCGEWISEIRNGVLASKKLCSEWSTKKSSYKHKASSTFSHPLRFLWRHRSLSHRKVIAHGMEPIITSLAYVLALNAAIYNPPACQVRTPLESLVSRVLAWPCLGSFWSNTSQAVNAHMNAQKNNIRASNRFSLIQFSAQWSPFWLFLNYTLAGILFSAVCSPRADAEIRADKKIRAGRCTGRAYLLDFWGRQPTCGGRLYCGHFSSLELFMFPRHSLISRRRWIITKIFTSTERTEFCFTIS